jgi:sn-glycerol 3-phosphate transport system permease protein
MQQENVVFRDKLLPYLLLFPQMVVIVVFFFWPAAQAVVQSMFMQDAFGLSLQFVWFENFEILFKDPDYLKSMETSVVFGSMVTVGSLGISLGFAAAAIKVRRHAMFYTTMIIWPYAVAPIVAGVLWMFLFNPSIGVVTWVITQMGIDWNYLLKGGQAMFLVVVAAIWRQVPYNFLFFIAGMQNIPDTLLEAAAIDGVRPLRRFWSVVFPLLTPVTFYLLVMNIVYAFFDTFAIIHQVTEGGPGRETTTMMYKAYEDGFQTLNLGSSSAQSVILMIIVMVLTVIQFRFIERKVEY